MIPTDDIDRITTAAERYDTALESLSEAINELPPDDRYTIRRRTLAVQAAHNDIILAVWKVLWVIVEKLSPVRDNRPGEGLM